MESIISHLIVDPTWVKMTATGSAILFGVLGIFTVIAADNDEKSCPITTNLKSIHV